jgi:hypothetical protein
MLQAGPSTRRHVCRLAQVGAVPLQCLVAAWGCHPQWQCMPAELPLLQRLDPSVHKNVLRLRCLLPHNMLKVALSPVTTLYQCWQTSTAGRVLTTRVVPSPTDIAILPSCSSSLATLLDQSHWLVCLARLHPSAVNSCMTLCHNPMLAVCSPRQCHCCFKSAVVAAAAAAC